jgi:hypothetical protein
VFIEMTTMAKTGFPEKGKGDLIIAPETKTVRTLDILCLFFYN